MNSTNEKIMISQMIAPEENENQTKTTMISKMQIQ